MKDGALQYDYHKHYKLVSPKSNYLKKGLSGLYNLGNKCYMSSILQCLSHTLQLTDYFLSCQYNNDDPEYLNKRKPEHILLTSFIQVLIKLWDKNQIVKPRSFITQLSSHSEKFGSNEQQDSHEFLVQFMSLLHKALSYEIQVEIKGQVKNQSDALMKTSHEQWARFYEKNYSVVIDMFHGLTLSQVECNECKCNENVFEPYNTLELNITPDSTALETCLDEYFNDNETIHNWKCDKCLSTTCNKSTSVWTLPNHLIIHLKRFQNNGEKVSSAVDFPIEDLNLTKYMSNDKKDPNNYIYTLYAINYHMGSANSGHYWSVCKNIDDNWYLFNDGHVSQQKVTEIQKKDAYILFYYRKMICP